MMVRVKVTDGFGRSRLSPNCVCTPVYEQSAPLGVFLIIQSPLISIMTRSFSHADPRRMRGSMAVVQRLEVKGA